MSVTTTGLSTSPSRRAWHSLIELFASMRFAITMLIVLAIASIIGTVLTQNDPYPNYVNQFGPFWADIFRTIGLYNVYSAWWFMLILAFLIVSVSLCITRNGPKMIAEARSWKDRVREGSLRAFGNRAEFDSPYGRAEVARALAALLKRDGYRHVVRDTDGATLIAAKRGAFNKIGYIFAHLAIVVICIGGLLDSNLPIRLQMWMFNKSPISSNAVIGTIDESHRLAQSNPSFRGYAWVPEGQNVSTAILNEPSGSLIQDLPFSIQLDKFIVDYYSTGMPKLFASNIVIIDHATGQRIPARVEVNEPVTYDGVSIYQSSFEDGGSTLQLSAYPMSGAQATPVPFKGTVGSTAPLGPASDGNSVEFTDFRAINVENITDASGKTDARGVTHQSLQQAFDQRLGSGAKAATPQNLHNIGPSFQYKVRDKNGQALEFNNYMLPTTVDGEQFFLAGVRSDPSAAFRFLRIPADNEGTVKQWMLLRAALQSPTLRAQAVQAFAQRSVGPQDAALREHLQTSAARVLDLFAGASAAADGKPQDPGAAGFTAVAGFIDQSVPKAEQQRAAGLLLRMLEGSVWDLWQAARAQNGLPAMPASAANSRFVESSINALSDSFFYGAPVFLQLDSFKQLQASVFQLTRAPGKKIVYLGSLLLVLGIFSMFYIRERRVWFWIKDASGTDASGPAGSTTLMAMSSARKTLDFEKEFAALRGSVQTMLGRPTPGAAAPTPEE